MMTLRRAKEKPYPGRIPDGHMVKGVSQECSIPALQASKVSGR